jgi:mycofactocin system glycosyltransferase
MTSWVCMRHNGTMKRATVPLPSGFGVVFDQDTQFIGTDVLFGGSPPRLLRLGAAEVRALEELRAGPVGAPDSGRLARRLTDAGLAHPRPHGAGPSDVTVVIPVRNRPAGLARCLSALGSDYPVIVVDDGSADPAAVAALCDKHGARLRRRPRPGGAGPARNDGLAMVTTPLVAFLDSDCAAGPEWIRQLAPHFADPMVGAVAPRVRPVTGPGSTGRYLDARPPIDLGPREAGVAPRTRVAYVSTAALLVRRDAIGAGFDPDLRYGEDVDFIWRMIDAGWRVRYDPSGLVSHTEPCRWTRVLARRLKYGKSAAPLSRRHPGRVPPLILQAWPAVSVSALLARRPLTAVTAYGAATAQLVGLLREWDVPARGVLRPMAESVLQTWLVMGKWSIQFALPAVAAGIVRPGGRTRLARTARRLALASLIAGPPAAEWLRTRPGLDPARFALWYLADEAAYGAGVYRGAATERTAAPLIPQIAWRPLPRPGEANETAT